MTNGKFISSRNKTKSIISKLKGAQLMIWIFYHFGLNNYRGTRDKKTDIYLTMPFQCCFSTMLCPFIIFTLVNNRPNLIWTFLRNEAQVIRGYQTNSDTHNTSKKVHLPVHTKKSTWQFEQPKKKNNWPIILDKLSLFLNLQWLQICFLGY